MTEWHCPRCRRVFRIPEVESSTDAAWSKICPDCQKTVEDSQDLVAEYTSEWGTLDDAAETSPHREKTIDDSGGLLAGLATEWGTLDDAAETSPHREKTIDDSGGLLAGLATEWDRLDDVGIDHAGSQSRKEVSEDEPVPNPLVPGDS